MKLYIGDKEREVVEVTHEELFETLKIAGNKKNVLVYGKSGEGKSAEILHYAEATGLIPLFVDLLQKLPEELSGIPTLLKQKDGYYTRAMDVELADFYEKKGKGYLLILDEINHGTPDMHNAIYSIMNTNPETRRWGTHPIPYCQIVAAGNFNDGTDYNVNLNDLPYPLHERCHIMVLKSSRAGTMKYLQTKYKNIIPEVKKFLEPLLDDGMSPRSIDGVLDTIAYCNANYTLLASKCGETLARKLLDIKSHIVVLDPIEKIKRAKIVYKQFKDHGDHFEWPTKTITTEKELAEVFMTEAGLTEEEVASIFKA
jgi:hypothetical protein